MNLPAILSDEDLAARLRAHAAAASGAYADETIRAIRGDVAKFTRWCVDTGLTPLPAYPETVAAFVDSRRPVALLPRSAATSPRLPVSTVPLRCRTPARRWWSPWR